MTSDGPASTPTWFGDAESPQFGWVHLPGGGTRCGVVLVPPFGLEYKNAHYTFRLLADRLSAIGCAVLRYDHPGTGDSAGDPEEFGWSDRWAQGLRNAVELLRNGGCGDIILIGMRLGATLVATEANSLAPLCGAVLWDPCFSGRSFVREQRMLGAVAAGLSVPEDVGGFVQGPSFLIPAELSTSLPWLTDSTVAPLSGTGQVLTLIRRGQKKPERLHDWLAATSHTLAEAVGQEELLQLPAPDQLVPRQALDLLVSWIDGLASTDTRAVEIATRSRTTIPLKSGQSVEEEAVTLGTGLFGLRTEPTTKPRGPVVVLVNVASDHHIGPGRLWVDLARHFADLGLRALRFDLSGVGDSPPRTGEPALVVRSLRAFDDMDEVMRAACPENPRNVVLIGLCASAYQILETALRRPVAGICAVNPMLGFLPPEMARPGSSMDPRRHFCIPPSRVIGVARMSPFLTAVKDRVPGLTWRARHLFSGKNLPAHRFQEVVALGVDTLLVCGPYEAMALRQSSPRIFAELEQTGIFRMETVADLDHSLPTLVSRIRAKDFVSRFVLDHYVSSPIGSSTPDPPELDQTTSTSGPA